MISFVCVFLFSREKDSATMVRNPIVPMKDSREPKDETVFQKVKASG